MCRVAGMPDPALRTRTPAGDPAWLVTDYDLVRQLLADPRLGRNHADPQNAPRYSESALFGRPQPVTPTAAADHARMRRLLTPWFSARRLDALRPRVRELVAGLLDELAAAGPPVDFHEAVSFPLPALVICELLGVPYADRADFRRWSDKAGDMTDQQRSYAGLGALFGYLSELVAAKRDNPAEDVLSGLVEAHRADPHDLPLDAVAQLGAGLLFAGHETTVAAIDKGVVLLSTNPDQRAALRADPALVDPAVEEILRSDIPTRPATPAGTSTGLARWASADIELGSVRIAAGDLVLLGLHPANESDRVVGDHPGFTVDRRPNPHLTFGHGAHFCIGAPLARLELRELFGELVHRFPGLDLAVPVAELRPRTGRLAGGLQELPVTW
jgi:cytochrome P450